MHVLTGAAKPHPAVLTQTRQKLHLLKPNPELFVSNRTFQFAGGGGEGIDEGLEIDSGEAPGGRLRGSCAI